MQGKIEDEIKFALEETAVKLIEIAKLKPVVIERDGVKRIDVTYTTGETVLLTIQDGKVTAATQV